MALALAVVGEGFGLRAYRRFSLEQALNLTPGIPGNHNRAAFNTYSRVWGYTMLYLNLLSIRNTVA